MKKIFVLSLFTLFCVSTYAQETIPISLKDSLKKEILYKLNNTEWEYWYGTNGKNMFKIEIMEQVVFNNDCLIFNFKKEGRKGGNVSVNLIENSITTSHNAYGNPPQINIRIGYNLLMISNPHYSEEGQSYDKKTEYANEKTLKLLELLKNYHDGYYVDTLVIQRAKELDDFTLLAQKHHASSEKPTITEEQRKYIVQANAANKEMKYQNALELYMTVAKINPTSYPEGYYNMALIAAEMKNYSFAIFNMKKYLILSPEASDARAAQDKIYEWEYFIIY